MSRNNPRMTKKQFPSHNGIRKNKILRNEFNKSKRFERRVGQQKSTCPLFMMPWFWFPNIVKIYYLHMCDVCDLCGKS